LAWRPGVTAAAMDLGSHAARRQWLVHRRLAVEAVASLRSLVLEHPAAKPPGGCPRKRCSRPVSWGARAQRRVPPRAELGRVWLPDAQVQARRRPCRAVGRRLGEACDLKGVHRQFACSRNHRSAAPAGVKSPTGANCPLLVTRPAVALARWEQSRESTSERVVERSLGWQKILEPRRWGCWRRRAEGWARPARTAERSVEPLRRGWAPAAPVGARKSEEPLP
jgi:hypothetical protein